MTLLLGGSVILGVEEGLVFAVLVVVRWGFEIQRGFGIQGVVGSCMGVGVGSCRVVDRGTVGQGVDRVVG